MEKWLEAFNKIAEEGVGRVKMKKHKKWIKGKWDHFIFEAVREKNKLRKEMSKVEGKEREGVVRKYRYWRNKVKKIQNAKKQRRRQEINQELENFCCKDEKKYWRCLKRLAGINKKEGNLPDEVRLLGDKTGKGKKKFGSVQ